MTSALRQTLASLVAPALLCLALLPHASHAAGITGSGRSASETRNLPEFQAIALGGSMDVLVRQGNTQSVRVEADDNLLALLETVVETVVETGSQGATLQLRWKQGQSVNTRSKVLVTVVVPKLTALAASGSGDIRLEQFSTPMLKLSISGSSDAKLVGLATAELGISISGSGDVRLADLKSDDVTVAIAGSGDAAVNAGKTLEIRIAGSGDVTYTGNPAVKSSVAGSGSINKK